MKYIMFESPEGGKFPVLFPEQITHLFMAAAVRAVVVTEQKTPWEPISAGFVSIGKCDVHGKSESLGGLGHGVSDAARMIIGDSVAFMPDVMVLHTLRVLEERTDAPPQP